MVLLYILTLYIIIKLILFLPMQKANYDYTIDSDIKQLEKITKLTTGQDEDFTRGCLLYYDCTKDHCKLISINVSM